MKYKNQDFLNNTLKVLVREINTEEDSKSEIYEILLILYRSQERIIITKEELSLINLHSLKFDDVSYSLWNKIKEKKKFIKI
ncbi:uncharacterized protein VNE69_09035 [Vairimorpha necatrix]|uniref:Uncharacterized protein n=1 Tax=Vairimorpha necatrix TaxID=6039 RepID=A0AAX4JEQ6_9MICR